MGPVRTRKGAGDDRQPDRETPDDPFKWWRDDDEEEGDE